MPSKTLKPDDPKAKRYEDLRKANLDQSKRQRSVTKPPAQDAKTTEG